MFFDFIIARAFIRSQDMEELVRKAMPNEILVKRELQLDEPLSTSCVNISVPTISSPRHCVRVFILQVSSSFFVSCVLSHWPTLAQPGELILAAAITV